MLVTVFRNIGIRYSSQEWGKCSSYAPSVSAMLHGAVLGGDVGSTEQYVAVRLAAARHHRALRQVVHEALGEEGVLVEVDHSGQRHVHGLGIWYTTRQRQHDNDITTTTPRKGAR